MKKSISELKDLYAGKEIFLIGSGASLDYYKPSFFAGKIWVGVNLVYRNINVEYSLFTHKPRFLEAIGHTPCVVAEKDLGENGKFGINEVDTEHTYWTFNVGKYNAFEENLECVGSDDTLCIGNSIATCAMNFCAHLGASTIYLVGFDCCTVDGEVYYKKYPVNEHDDKLDNGQIDTYRHYTNDFFVRNAREMFLMKKVIELRYNCAVVSISPFMGLKNSTVVLNDHLSIGETRMAILRGRG